MNLIDDGIDRPDLLNMKCTGLGVLQLKTAVTIIVTFLDRRKRIK